MTEQPSQSAGPPSRPPEQWWAHFFDEQYARMGLRATETEQNYAIADFLISRLELQPGSLVLDQCCGVGRISIPLAARGMRVVGVDLIQSYITCARQDAGASDDPHIAERCAFHCADAMEFRAAEPCDAAFNWFTSFGYSDDDEVNIRMLHRAYESLRPGGWFMLDCHNITHIMRNYQWRHYSCVETPQGTLTVLSAHKPDFVRGVLDQTWTFIEPDGTREERHLGTRMYMPHELVNLFRRAGFTDVELLGSIEGEAFSMNSRRCIVLARRPATSPPAA